MIHKQVIHVRLRKIGMEKFPHYSRFSNRDLNIRDITRKFVLTQESGL